MTKNTSVCIKALRGRGGLIQWNYDTPRQAAWLWRELTKTGNAPDTGEQLASACYFLGDKVDPHRYWEKGAAERAEHLRGMGVI